MNQLGIDICSFEYIVLCIINEERKKFGLRDSDFHRYRLVMSQNLRIVCILTESKILPVCCRTHCTQKLKTLRKSTGVQQAYNPKTKQLVKKSLADKNSLEGINDVETLKSVQFIERYNSEEIS
jgi:hypothetical protein